VSKTIVRGVVLEKDPNIRKMEIGETENLYRLLSSYISSPLRNTVMSIKLNHETYQIDIDNNGSFNLELRLIFESKPDISIIVKENELQINQDYCVFFKNSLNSVDVISDIDDTIIVSHSSNIIKRVGLLSLVLPHNRKHIKFTKTILTYISTYSARVFYVSKSESNLFDILSSFIKHNQLPEGMLILTPYLNLKQLIINKKDKYFKLDSIKFIFENSGDKKFVLFGDDSQLDMEVYTHLAESYPGKVARIYIRQTRKSVNKKRFILWQKLKNTFSDSVYFNSSTDMDQELLKLGNIMDSKNN